MRQTIIAGNWKMQGTLSFVDGYLNTLLPELVSSLDKRILLSVPYTLLFSAAKKAEGSLLEIGAQNVSDKDPGALTGEIACSMLLDAGARFVIIGHSERRHILQESDDVIQKKVVKSVASGLKTILCIGETLREKESGAAESVLKRQITSALSTLSSDDMSKVILAYEPVWAIGTGVHATPDLAERLHAYCRSVIADLFDEKTAEFMPILYGGSVKPDNIAGFVQQDNIDGALVGGASLDPLDFLRIIQSS